MKKAFAFLLLLACIYALQAQTPAKNKIVFMADRDYLEACETNKGDCKPVVLERTTMKDSVLIVFPGGSTSSNVNLYTGTAYSKWLNGSPNDEPVAIKHDTKSGLQGKPVLDLTGLPDGTYYAHMLSCSLDGAFQIIIRTPCEPKC